MRVIVEAKGEYFSAGITDSEGMTNNEVCMAVALLEKMKLELLRQISNEIEVNKK